MNEQELNELYTAQSQGRNVFGYSMEILHPSFAKPTLEKQVARFMQNNGINEYRHITEWLVEADGKYFLWVDELNPEEQEQRSAFANAYKEGLLKQQNAPAPAGSTS